MNRSEMREAAFRFLYSAEIQKDINVNNVKDFLESNETTSDQVAEYVQDIAEGVETNTEDIKKTIEKNLKSDWTYDRVSKVNLALLKLAIYEIKYKKLPYKAMINEVVELAKRYGEENTSQQFVNGILASVVKELEE